MSNISFLKEEINGHLQTLESKYLEFIKEFNEFNNMKEKVISGSRRDFNYLKEDINTKKNEITKLIAQFIEEECEPFDTLKLQYIVPTAHGKHLICKPFNTAKFGQKYPEVDVHKNNPTLLYFEALN